MFAYSGNVSVILELFLTSNTPTSEAESLNLEEKDERLVVLSILVNLSHNERSAEVKTNVYLLASELLLSHVGIVDNC